MQVSYIHTPGTVLYAFPDDESLADWLTERVILTEGTGDNTGRYTADLTVKLWRIFVGATQPASWNLTIGLVELGTPTPNVSTVYTPGSTLYAYPDSASLTDYAGGGTSRIQLVEQAAPNTGRYIATLLPGVSQLWRTFVGATQPANWNTSVGFFDLSNLSPVSDYCLVILQTNNGIIGIQTFVRIYSSLEGRENEHAFTKISFEGVTDTSGNIEVNLPYSSLPGVGDYTFEIYDNVNRNRILHRRTATVPDASSALYGDLA